MQFEELLKRAMARAASDLHITAEAPPVVRVQGRIQALDGAVIRAPDTEAFAEALLDEQRRQKFRNTGEVSMSYSVSGLGRFRVMVFRQRGSVALSVRLVYPGIPGLADVGLPPILGDFAMRAAGLVLVTGPRGSGKTLALAGMVDYINGHKNAHVVTLEDPIEYLHKHRRSIVNQREVGVDTPSFAHGLRSATRQDPDVLAVGDVLDAETTRLCLEAACSGCLVLCATRAPGIEGALKSLYSMFGAEQRPGIAGLFADCVEGAVGLRIVQTSRMSRPLPVCEVLVGTPAVKDILREDRLHHIGAVMKTGLKAGMKTFAMSLDELLREGQITDDEYAGLSEPVKALE